MVLDSESQRPKKQNETQRRTRLRTRLALKPGIDFRSSVYRRSWNIWNCNHHRERRGRKSDTELCCNSSDFQARRSKHASHLVNSPWTRGFGAPAQNHLISAQLLSPRLSCPLLSAKLSKGQASPHSFPLFILHTRTGSQAGEHDLFLSHPVHILHHIGASLPSVGLRFFFPLPKLGDAH